MTLFQPRELLLVSKKKNLTQLTDTKSYCHQRSTSIIGQQTPTLVIVTNQLDHKPISNILNRVFQTDDGTEEDTGRSKYNQNRYFNTGVVV